MQVRRWHKVLVLVVVLLCVFAIGMIAKRERAGASSPAGESAAAAVPYAAVAPVKRENIATQLSIAGQFIPYQNVELHAKVAGYIRNINVDIGDRVRQGQVLAVLEIPELVAEVQGAQAAVHHAEEEIQRAQSDVSRAQADSVALHANAERLTNTDKVRPGLIAQQELDDATAKDRASQAQVDAAKSSLAAARQQREVARANLAHYSALSDYAKITAPYDGVVTWRFSDTGSLVQAGTSSTSGLPVVTIAQINVLRLRIPAPESIAGKIRIGDTADVHVQATGEHFTGKVARFTNSLDPATRTMQVEIDVPNPNYRLQPGMYADVNLAYGNEPNALVVPLTAIQRHGNETTVLVVNLQNKVERRTVQLGTQDSNNVQIISGVSQGERVIVGNPASYRSGELVQPKESTAVTANGESE